jgi:hypothetical protein
MAMYIWQYMVSVIQDNVFLHYLCTALEIGYNANNVEFTQKISVGNNITIIKFQLGLLFAKF